MENKDSIMLTEKDEENDATFATTMEEEHDDLCCPICLAVPEEDCTVEGPCGHGLCVSCMERILLEKRPLPSYYNPETDPDSHLVAPTLGRCPICRDELSLFELRKVHLHNPKTDDSSGPFVEKNMDIHESSIAGYIYAHQQQVVGRFSFHFPTASDVTNQHDAQGRPLPYMSFESVGDAVRLDDGSVPPARKYFDEGCHFHHETSTFHGRLVWNKDDLERTVTLNGSAVWEVVMQFSDDWHQVSGGTLVKRRDPPPHKVQVFGRSLLYHRVQADGTPTSPVTLQEAKLGAKCCGCCCDMRRAVIVVNAMSIVWNFASMLFLLSGRDWVSREIDDDDAAEILEDSYSDQAIIAGVGMVVLVVVIVGAARYNIYLVGLGVIWYLVSYVTSSVLAFLAFNDFDDQYEGSEDIGDPLSSILLGVVLTGLFIYPHVGLMVELKNGIMTPETYAREEFSCCCVG